MNVITNPAHAVYTSADYIISVLQHLGVEKIFGVPGGAIEPFFNAIARTTSPQLIVARHESGAAFMADGYYRETKKLSVVCSTTGPGATNLITGVGSAYCESIPMLVITAQTPLPKFGRKSLQDSSATAIDTMAMFEAVTVYNSMVSHPDQLEHMLSAAINAALTHRAPVHLSIPSDVMRSVTRRRDMPMFRTYSGVDASAVTNLCSRVLAAERIAICIGENGDACKETMHFIMQTNCPFVCTPMGKSYANEYHPKFRGVVGFAGHNSANSLLEDDSIDLILAIGTSLDELSTNGWTNGLCSSKVIHIDSNLEHFTRSLTATHVYGDIQLIMDQLLKCIIANNKLFAPPRDVHTLHVKDNIRCHQECSPVKPQYLMHYMAKLSDEVRFYIDAGNSWAWATHYLLRENITGNYRIAMGFGSMGWSIGACIGSALATRKPTICVVGDGSYLMSAQEISVAVQHQLPIIFVVLNDSAMGMVMHGQRLGGQESIGWELPVVNFAMMAQAIGAKGYVVNNSKELDELCFENMFAQGPCLVDVRIDRDEVPPMGDRIQGLSKSVTPGA